MKRHRQHWSIGIYTGDSIFSLHPPPNIANPVLTAKDVTDVSAEIIADPFMVHHDSKWYMFFEVWNAATNHADIALAVSDDGLNWKYEQVVLDECFHLSYPYVFEWKKEFYMVPDCSLTGSVRLYRAVSFPTKWLVERTLLYGKYVDTSLFRFNGMWWLFTSEPSCDVLHLFYADELTGPWVKHVRSPVVRKNANIARPGGRVLVLDGHIVRFAQDCVPVYGSQVRAFEITELSTTNYAEREMPTSPILKGNGAGWNAKGMHHLDPHKAEGKGWIACVDGWRPKLLFGLNY